MSKLTYKEIVDAYDKAGSMMYSTSSNYPYGKAKINNRHYLVIIAKNASEETYGIALYARVNPNIYYSNVITNMQLTALDWKAAI